MQAEQVKRDATSEKVTSVIEGTFAMHGGERKNDTGGPGLFPGALQAAAWPRSVLLSGQPIEEVESLSSTISRYAIAILSIAAAVAAAKLAVAFLQVEPFVSLFLCAIMLSGWLGGFGPGLLATVLALLAFDYYLVAPVHSLALEAKQLPRLALFLIVGLSVNWMSSAQRKGTKSLERSRNDLLAALEDQRRIEVRLLQSETYLAEAQRLSQTGSFGWNIATGGLLWSEETFRIFQCDPTTKPTLEFLLQRVHPEDRDVVQQTIDRASSDGKAFDHEYRLLMPDGAVKHVRALAHALQDEAGSVQFVGAVTDVTAAEQAEEELRRSEQRFRDFAETASDWFWETGPDHRLTSVSRKSITVAGRVGMAIWEFAADVEEEPEKWRLHIATLNEHKPFRGFRYKPKHADGPPIYFAASGKPLFDPEGNFLGYRGVASDVTATVRAEQAEAALHEAQADLAHATRVTMLGELTASIAHEVNQPLAAIVTNAEACLRWLDRGADNMDAARRSVEWIIKDGNRAAEVIGRVRALATKTDTERSRFNVNDVVHEVCTLVERELSNSQVSLRMALAPVPLLVCADRVQLQQVIINLVMNGIEAMQSVTDRREMVIRSQQNEANQVMVMVEDCGVGISPENANRLFKAFFTTKSSGLGLGLSICRSIVEAHGGRMSASCNAGPGATFQFTLPCHQDGSY
jgi:PAS domain S-box-containing protein